MFGHSIRRWARSKAGTPGIPTGFVSAIALLFSIIFKDALSDAVKRVAKAFAVDAMSAPMGDTLASWIGVLSFVAFAAGAFLFGYFYAGWRKPEVFLSRNDLERFSPGPFKGVKSVHAVFIVGQKFLEDSSGVPDSGIKLILPEPKSASLKFILSTIEFASDPAHLAKMISEAKRRGVALRISPEFSGSSWWIGNRQDDDPFVHIEVILPYLMRPHRPSFRVYRSQDQEFFYRYCELFDKLWEKSKSA